MTTETALGQDSTKTAKKPSGKGGLDGVVVAETRLSDVDGEQGKLTIAGYDAEWIAERGRFEDVVSLLEKALASSGPAGLDEGAGNVVSAELGRAREEAFRMIGDLGNALSIQNGMDSLRASIAHLPEDADDRLIAGAVAVFAAGWHRANAGLSVLAPDPRLGHAADYLRMITGTPPDEARARALDTYLVTVADHGMNASTFTARVITSTGSDSVSSVVGAIGALKGPLHGGAPGPVLDMLDAVVSKERARSWLEDRVARGERIMGMGHRIYRTRDPRAAILESALRRLSERGAENPRLALAREVEHAAETLLAERHPDRPLKANVEFYTAVLLEAVGLPRQSFTTTFAVGRVAGWLAHIREQRALARLLRPASVYIGPRHSGT